MQSFARWIFSARLRPAPFVAALPALVFATALGVALPAAPALAVCGQPTGQGDSPTLQDCLHIARASVARESCAPCVCDTNGSGEVRVTDALRCLWYVVGADVSLDCPPCSGSTTTTTLPSCAPCGQVLLGLADPADLCAEDIELYDALRLCPCNHCHEECRLLCPSREPSASSTSSLVIDPKLCSTCYAEHCAPLLGECVER